MAVFSGNGAVGSPSFTFSSDTNTGIYRAGEDQLSVTTGGLNSAEFDDSQRFLVGLTSTNQPTASLVAANQIISDNVARNDLQAVFGQVSTATTNAYEVDLASYASRYMTPSSIGGRILTRSAASGFIGYFLGDQTVKVRFIETYVVPVYQLYTLKLSVWLQHNNLGIVDFLEKTYAVYFKIPAASTGGIGTTPIWESTKPGFTNGTLAFSISNFDDRGISQGSDPWWFEFDLALTSGRTLPKYAVSYTIEGIGGIG